jgi:glycosyltransferase involved in cell wall biosynthesis
VTPLVTALVDTFNHERFLEQALVSVLDQGLSPSELEIVVVDDGSTDQTPSVVQKFLPRVKYLRKKNGGQASAFNAAFPEINGQIVSLLDGDDWWAKGKLSTVIDALEQNREISAVGHGFYDVDEATNNIQVCVPQETKDLNLETPQAAGEALLRWHFLRTSTITVRRKAFEQVIPIPEQFVFSADSPIAMVSMARGVRILAMPLCYYRRHSGNLYAVDAKNMAGLRRKCDMDELMFEMLGPLLIRLGVSTECVSALLDPPWVTASRLSLSTFGGSRLKTFRTEMRSFHSEYKNPSMGYILFKRLIMGATIFLLPPRRFYSVRDWYAQHNLGRLRNLVFRPRSR